MRATIGGWGSPSAYTFLRVAFSIYRSRSARCRRIHGMLSMSKLIYREG
jgi:hypothetical protein